VAALFDIPKSKAWSSDFSTFLHGGNPVQHEEKSKFQRTTSNRRSFYRAEKLKEEPLIWRVQLKQTESPGDGTGG
jgi:hypothetical protein